MKIALFRVLHPVFVFFVHEQGYDAPTYYYAQQKQDGGIGNGRGVRNLFEKMVGSRAERRAATPEILPDDLPDPISFREEEARAIIAGLEERLPLIFFCIFVNLPSAVLILLRLGTHLHR